MQEILGGNCSIFQTLSILQTASTTLPFLSYLKKMIHFVHQIYIRVYFFLPSLAHHDTNFSLCMSPLLFTTVPLRSNYFLELLFSPFPLLTVISLSCLPSQSSSLGLVPLYLFTNYILIFLQLSHIKIQGSCLTSMACLMPQCCHCV